MAEVLSKDKALYAFFQKCTHNYCYARDGAGAYFLDENGDPVMSPSGWLPAYPETAVPDSADLPYLTYTPAYGAFGEGQVSITVNLWFRTKLEDAPNAAVQELSARIGGSGRTIPCAGGVIWLKRGSPFAQAVRDPDRNLKRRYINITAEYLTAD